MASPLPGFENVQWVLDSSAAINFQKSIPVADQQAFWAGLLDLVRAGRLVFPIQVKAEVGDVKRPDALARWVKEVMDELDSLPAPSDTTVSTVVRKYPNLLRGFSEREIADPYVVALAIERSRAGREVHVVSDDQAIQAVCMDCDIAVQTWSEFYERVRA